MPATLVEIAEFGKTLFVCEGLNGKYPDPLVLEYFQTTVPRFVVKLTSMAEPPIQIT